VVLLAPADRFSRAAVTVVLISALAGCATYRKCGFAGCPGDAKITHSVQTLMSKYPALQAPNLIRVQTTDHVVYLYGEVNTELERSTAESVARAVPGVTRVVDSISFDYGGR
jgi:osmotically-inducible protein OsmY